jgi:ribonuclease BN (tRNA processing enzyme)
MRFSIHSDHIGDLGELQLRTWAGGSLSVGPVLSDCPSRRASDAVHHLGDGGSRGHSGWSAVTGQGS